MMVMMKCIYDKVIIYIIHIVPPDEMDDRTVAVCDLFETSVCRTSVTHYVLRGQG